MENPEMKFHDADDDVHMDAQGGMGSFGGEQRGDTPQFKHSCKEWDGLEIDETFPEFEACLCFKKPISEAQPLPAATDVQFPDKPAVHESEGYTSSNRSYKWKWIYESDFDEYEKETKTYIEALEAELSRLTETDELARKFGNEMMRNLRRNVAAERALDYLEGK